MPVVLWWGVAALAGGFGIKQASDGLGDNFVKVAGAGAVTYLTLKKLKVI